MGKTARLQLTLKKRMNPNLSKAELIQLADKLINFYSEESELVRLMEKFNDNVPHPWGANLAFSPGRGEPRVPNYQPTAADIVEKALAYKRLPQSLLTESDRTVIFECVNAAVNGPFLPDWEFPILFGLERKTVAQMLETWSELDIFVDDDVAVAINNSMNNLRGYPHRKDNVWDEWVSVPKEQIRPLLNKWYHMVEWLTKPIIIHSARIKSD